MKKLAATLLLMLFMAVPIFGEQGGSFPSTLFVSGKAVVFFGPSWEEYVSMAEEEKKAINAALYDFSHYRLRVLSYLEANEIQEFNSAYPIIKIQLADNRIITYLRDDFDYAFGMIMTDGQQQPQVFLGAANDSELKAMFAEFFGP